MPEGRRWILVGLAIADAFDGERARIAGGGASTAGPGSWDQPPVLEVPTT
jgi:hypothetical protein